MSKKLIGTTKAKNQERKNSLSSHTKQFKSLKAVPVVSPLAVVVVPSFVVGCWSGWTEKMKDKIMNWIRT